jgi:hypothetical protein
MPQDGLNNRSLEEMFIWLHALIKNSPGGQNDDLQSSNWKLTPGFAGYKCKEINVAGVPLKLLYRFVEAKGEPVNIADLK